MHQRRFGRLGWSVSDIGYGMWGMGGWTGSEDAKSLAATKLRGQKVVVRRDRDAGAASRGGDDQPRPHRAKPPRPND